MFGTREGTRVGGIALGSGGLCVAGGTNGAFPGQTASGPPGTSDAYIRAYGTSGAVLWTRQFGTTADDEALSVTADLTAVFTAGAAPRPVPPAPAKKPGEALLGEKTPASDR